MAGAGSKAKGRTIADDADTVAYGRTPLGQLIYDLGFARLKDATIARKHGLPVETVRRYRAAFDRGMKQGKAIERERKAKRQGR